MTLGQRIQDLRKKAGLSQEGLGEALGVSRQAVSKWESDGGVPELDTLIALSKLFHITIGELLGVEETEPPKEEYRTDSFDEEKVEEILRRYAEESRRTEEAGKETKPPAGSWILAAGAILLTVIVAVIAVGRVRGFKITVSDLRSQISVLQSDLSSMRYQVGGLSEELRGILEEQSSLLSNFEYSVVAFNVEEETVDIRLSTTLKAYTAGSRVQFVLRWLKTDFSQGELVCDAVEGPKFETTATIPMNFQLEVFVQILQPDGTILEQLVNTVYGGMHPDNFSLRLNTAACGGHSTAEGVTSMTCDVELVSEWSELIYPVRAFVIFCAEGEEVQRRPVELTDRGDGFYTLTGAFEFDSPVQQDEIEIWYEVTDNYGRKNTQRIN